MRSSLESLEPSDEKYYGLVNFGNTCYCNSVLQALYFCRSFRRRILCETPMTAALKLYNVALQFAARVEAAQLSTSASSVSSGSNLESEEEYNVPPLRVTSGSLPRRSSSKKSSSKFYSSSKKGNTLQSFPNASTFQPNVSSQESRGPKLLGAIPDTAQTKNLLDFVSKLEKEENLLTCLQELFFKIKGMKKKHGFLSPTSFISRLKKESEMFNSSMHQDAHELLNFLLNDISETLTKRYGELAKLVAACFPELTYPQNQRLLALLVSTKVSQTAIHAFFEGVLTNETRCLTCETVTSKDESFLELSVNVEPNSSLASCLRSFSAVELLDAKNKFFCDKCRALQNAEKRLKLKTLPAILAIHLKRFKYQESLQRYIKLSHEVLFSNELRVWKQDESAEAPALYSLVAIVVHIGTALNHGHYVTLLPPATKKSEPTAVAPVGIGNEQWILLDDDVVELVDASEVCKIIGGEHSLCNDLEVREKNSWLPVDKQYASAPTSQATDPSANDKPVASGVKGTGYIFFYQNCTLASN